MKMFTPSLWACLLLFSQFSWSQKMQPYGFIENRGQIKTQDDANSPTRFVYTAQSGLNVQIHEGGFSYDAYQIIRDTLIVDPKTKKSRKLPRTYQFHRVDIDFPGSNPDVKIESLETAKDYLVYYPAEHPAGLRVRHHRKVIYHNLYPHIDLELVANPGTEKAFEYNFILHPGADLADIKIRYQGALKTHFHPDFLDLQLSMGSLRESIPASFWVESKQEVPLTYRLIEQDRRPEGALTVGFSGPSGALNQTLVIDPIPSLKWSTYFGSIGYDFGWDLEYDGKGQLYLCGSTESTSNIATRGVHQSIHNGDNDALIAKFDTNGQRIWASYFGGSRDDSATNIHLSSKTELIITGYTLSNDDIASPGVEGAQRSGREDVFLAKFTTDGNRIWSRYWGGPSYDYANALTTNQRGDILIGGGTFSETGIAAPGQLQDRFSFRTDGFLVQFTAEGQYITSSYLGGGDNDDDVNDLLCDTKDNIYVIGTTYSSNGVILRNAYQNRNAGGADVMLWKLDSNFTIIWSTYLGGTGDDGGRSLALDAQENLYFTGATYSSNYPLGSNAGLYTLGGTTGALVTKFSADGRLLWASYLGGNGNEYGGDLKLDPLGSGAIFVAGGTNESPGFVGSKAWQTEYGGGQGDAFLAKLNASGQLLWSTYYGGTGNDGFRAMEVDSNKNIYCLGSTSSPNGLATPNAQQNYYGGDGTDLLLSSFKDCYAPLAPQNTTPAINLRICGGLRTTLKAQGEGFIKWFDQPDGGRLLGEGDSLRTLPLFATTTYYIQDSVCGRSRTRTAVTVQVDPRPDVSAGSPLTVCAGERVMLSGRGAIFYLWDGGAINGIPFAPRETRTYTVVGTGAFGCRDTAQLLITVLPRPEVSAGPDRRLCPGEGLVLQGTGALRYTWDRGVTNGQRFVPASAGTYTVIGESNGCKDTASMTINLMPKPTVDAGPERRVCAGDTLSLRGSGVLTYEWDWDVKNAQPFQATQSRLYTVIGIDANQCRDTAQVQVSILPKPRISAGSDWVICEGEQIRLEGKGAQTYTWDHGVINNQLFRPSSTATYTLIGRDANNCADTARVQVQVNPRPIIELPATIGACIGETVTIEPRVSGGAGGYTYSWSGGFRGTSIQIEAQYNLEFRLLITDQKRCEARDTTFMVVNAPPQVAITGPDSICIGDQATLESVITVGRPPYRYIWQDGQSTAQITVSPRETSTYTLIIEDGNGCRDTANYTLQVFATPDLRVDPGLDIVLCSGIPVTVKVSGADEYIWRGPVGFQSTDSTVYMSVPNHGRYDITGINFRGACSASTSFQITTPPIPLTKIEGPSSICRGDSLILSSFQGGIIEWSTGDRTREIRLKPTQTETYRLVLTSQNQCSDTAYLTVKLNERPEVSAGPDRQICAGDSLILQGNGALSYIWDAGVLDGKAFFPKETRSYTMIGTNAEGCRDTAQVQVQVNPGPKLELPPSIEVCAGETVNLEPQVSGGIVPYTYTWSNGFSGNKIQFRPSNRSSLGLRIADGQGCETRGNISILVNALPDLSITGPKQLCAGDKATLKKSIAMGRPPYRYSWQDGQSAEQIEVAPQETSTYSLIVQDANACRDTANYTLQVQAHPELTLLPEYKIKLGQSLKLVAGTQPGNYQWSPSDGLSCTDCPDPELSITESRKYCVTVVSEGNCQSEACTEVTFEGKCQVYMPNVFSPNGDQINDVFCAYSPCIAEAQLWVYDRWGNLVFQSNPNEPQPCWDGRSKGQTMDTGTYYYRLRGVDVLGKAVDLQGSVSLLR